MELGNVINQGYKLISFKTTLVILQREWPKWLKQMVRRLVRKLLK